ncbi:MAG: NUDIX hydrolase [Chitinophagaceae bacterium]
MDQYGNPWQIIAQKQVYDNKWISVTEYDVINPGGGNGIYGKIHFKNLAIGVIVLDDKWNTYLVGQYRFVLDAYSWEIPEGGGHPGAGPLDSAKRELLEETGLVAREWTLLCNVHLSNSVSNEYGYIYLARGLEQQTAAPEETEQLIVRKLTFDEAWQMTENGQITDSLSVIAIQKLKLLQLQGKLV